MVAPPDGEGAWTWTCWGVASWGDRAHEDHSRDVGVHSRGQMAVFRTAWAGAVVLSCHEVADPSCREGADPAFLGAVHASRVVVDHHGTVVEVHLSGRVEDLGVYNQKCDLVIIH